MGDALYRAKITLSTPDVFAWTLVIVLLSALLSAGSGPIAADGQSTALRGGAGMSIVIQNLCKRFAGREVLRNFCWTVEQPVVTHGGRAGMRQEPPCCVS